MASRRNESILLTPIRFPVEWIDPEILEKVGVIFRRDVRVEPQELDLDTFYDPVRDQYHSTAILKHFILERPAGTDRSCFLVTEDLYIPILTFVFGEAHMHGRHCIVSSHRLREEFYLRDPDPGLLRDRLLKEIVHELGHTFGLIHCFDDLCVMNNSYGISGTDRKSCFPCELCFEKLDEVL